MRHIFFLNQATRAPPRFSKKLRIGHSLHDRFRGLVRLVRNQNPRAIFRQKIHVATFCKDHGQPLGECLQMSDGLAFIVGKGDKRVRCSQIVVLLVSEYGTCNDDP